MMDELLEQFLIEGRELVAQATKGLAALGLDAADRAALDSAFRATHTLKGSAAILDLAPAEKLLHAAEDVLERAHKGLSPLTKQSLESLVACVDQVDRWLDELETTGALGKDAAAVSARIAASLSTGEDVQSSAPSSALPEAEWVKALVEREADIISAAEGPLLAFRYTPDAECFFRGEDPLTIAESVPDLLSLSLMPVGGRWPASADLDPYSCFSIIEGISSGSRAELQTAFRLQPDQISYAAVDSGTPTSDRQTAAVATGTLRVDIARIDAMAEDFSELVVAVNSLPPLVAEAQGIDRALAAHLRAAQTRIDRAIANFHRNLNSVRMVPLAPSLRRLPRMAREIAQSLGKDISLVIEGETLEVDKQIADSLFEPLLHLVRNAIDHGLETPPGRAEAGKPPTGTITLSFRRHGDDVIATLADDGTGIDPERIRQLATARGLITEEKAGTLGEDASLRLIFAPGFSTAGEVTELSGRGVGMDVVRNAIEHLRGSIDIESEPGRGTVFRMRLPANALTTQLLVVEVGDERFGVPLDQVVETVRIGQEALLPVGSGQACVLRGRTIPVLDLAALLDAPATHGKHAKLLVTQAGGELVALRVADFAERLDTVVRPSEGLLASAPHVGGSALMGDGGILLVLDLPELAA